MQPSTSADLDRVSVSRAYAAWAPIYDAICGPILASGRRAAASAASTAGKQILEVGVGTGLSFMDYAPGTEITGIDFSERMITRARAKVAAGGYPQVKNLLIMDAHDLAFPDESFDCVVAPFVITLVNNPERVLSECARVTRIGGEVVLVNHLYSEQGLIAAFERWAGQRAGVLGLRPDFPFSRIENWVKSTVDVELIERRRVRPLRAYTLIRMRRLDGGRPSLNG
jgi:ubiquinone/menaquinone biosynthesis C-methylase UbiE